MGGRLPCPCCGCLTITEAGGYDICPVCRWEDDGQGDDEADNASVNTGALPDPDEDALERDPTTINRLIRTLLLKFKKRAYVGYTATPFAKGNLNGDGTYSLQGSMAGRVYLLQAIAAGFLMASDSPKVGEVRKAVRDEKPAARSSSVPWSSTASTRGEKDESWTATFP